MQSEGDKAPDFKLKAKDGKDYSLPDFKGKKLVLYFYPKDDTSGCTCEAKEFSEQIKEFEKKGAFVVGVSPDSIESHAKFEQKHSLKVLLLSDPEKKCCSAYGVWVEKSMYGRKYMGVERSTFIINSTGIVEKVFRKVKAEGHANEVMVCLTG